MVARFALELGEVERVAAELERHQHEQRQPPLDDRRGMKVPDGKRGSGIEQRVGQAVEAPQARCRDTKSAGDDAVEDVREKCRDEAAPEGASGGRQQCEYQNDRRERCAERGQEEWNTLQDDDTCRYRWFPQIQALVARLSMRRLSL